MAFKNRSKQSTAPETPIELFRGLARRKFPTEMPHQRQILEQYVKQGITDTDVAIQLPTGSGKTLVGLLIAEWRRRKFGEKVLYLCPTRQLVYQTYEQAEKNYGLSVIPFVGPKSDYEPGSVSKYKSSSSVAISTYSSLFNTNPFFDNPDTIVVDDAHAAENYIASMWTLEIDSNKSEHAVLFAAVSTIIRPYLTPLDYQRLTRQDSAERDVAWVDKLPTPSLIEISDDLVAVLEEHTPHMELWFKWILLQDHINACHVYLSKGKITIRPLIPPTFVHPAFFKAKQRIFMSATLGEGGDLERLTGRSNISRISVPEGFGLENVGRRYFIFPSMSLSVNDIDILRLEMMKRAGRSVVLSPSNESSNSITARVRDTLKFPFYTARDIENSKAAFTDQDQAVAAFAGRYDGIDFPHEECRFLCVDGLPTAINAQERFIMSRMGSHILFNERIQTRVLQAIGRCTRALQDSSAVYVTGSELQDYLTDSERRRAFHPELQAEILFGIEQSQEMTMRDFLENLDVFLKNGDEWEEANTGILEQANDLVRHRPALLDELSEAAKCEIDYQEAMWSDDFINAYAAAQSVLGQLTHPDLKGYRALWHYLAGGAAMLAAVDGDDSLQAAARLQFGKAKGATKALPWLVKLSRHQQTASDEQEIDLDLAQQVENLESNLCKLGLTHDGGYVKLEKAIIEGLSSPESFENAHKELGTLLGFECNNVESEGSPDPWWISQKFCFVFEDHAGAMSTSTLSTSKARQVSGHPNWMMENEPVASNLNIMPILISPVEKADTGALPHLNNVFLWPLDEFRQWAQHSLSVVRELRVTLTTPGDLVWRAKASEMLDVNRFSACALAEDRQQHVAAKVLA